MPFVNKFKILVCTACLMLVGQGFAFDCVDGTGWGDFEIVSVAPNDTGAYEIDTPEKLAWFSCKVEHDNTNFKNATAILTKSIDMQGKLFIPIAAGTGTPAFAGVFDGQGFTISNLYIDGSAVNNDAVSEVTEKSKNGAQAYAQNIGLVGVLSGTIQNLTLKDAQIYAASSAGSTGMAEPKPISVGTFVGWAGEGSPKILNCVASGTIVTSGATNRVGGIVGNVKNITISNCVSSVNIAASGEDTHVGGIVGALRNNGSITITSCVYSGTSLHTVDGSVGAIAGNYESVKTIKTEKLFYSDEFCEEFENESDCKGIGVLPNGKKFNTEEKDNLNSEDVVCELNGGKWSNGTCTEAKSETWSVGQNDVSMNGSDGYKITFNANGGNFAPGAKTSKVVANGGSITADEITPPTKEGMKFAGWSLSSTAEDPDKNLGVANAAKTLYAVWYDFYEVTFKTGSETMFSDATFPGGGNTRTITVAKYGLVSVDGFAVPTVYKDANNVTYYFTGWAYAPKSFGEDDDINPNDTLHLSAIDVTESIVLYAVWTKAKTYSVTFDATLDGKTDVHFVKIITEGETVSRPTEEITDAGYKVVGWCVIENCTEENEYDFSKTLKGNLVLHARWSLVQYDIIYENMVGASNTGNPSSYNINSETITFAAPTKGGHIFGGWFYDQELTSPATKIDAGSMGDKTVYAKWTPITFTIQYLSGNTISATVKSVTKDYDTPVLLYGQREEFAHVGCTHDGWSKADYGQEGYNKDYELGANYTENADIKLYPHWTCNAYDITYVITGAEGIASNHEDNPAQYVGPAKLTLKNAYDSQDRIFMDDWYLENTYKNTIRFVQDINAPLTVYARWYNKITYKPGSNVSGVKDVEDKKYLNKNYTIKSSIKTFVRTNYTLDGWSTTDGGEKVYALGVKYSTNENLTLYPHWVADEHNITYNNVDPSELPEGYPTTYTHENAVTLPVPTRNGYEFLGWYVDDEFNGNAVTEIPENQTEDKEFFAKWSDAVEYSITYDLDDGTNDVDNPASYTVETPAFTLKDAVKLGYTFNGWFNESDVPVTTVAGGATGNIELTAKWTPVEYTITYENVNGATNDNASAYTIEQTVALNALEKDGFAFRGWFTNAQFTGDPVIDISAGASGDTTFYAKWLEIFTITYAAGNDEGVTGQVAAGTKTETENATLSSEGFARTGYTQTGWKTEDGSATYDMGGSYTADASVTLYPIWNVETYNVVYHNVDGATFVPNPETYTVEDVFPIALNSPAKVGFTFLGWSLVDNSTEYVDEIVAGSTGEVNFYANWELAPSPITVAASSGTFEFDKQTHNATCSYEGTLPTGYSIEMVPSGSVKNVADGEVTTTCAVTIKDESDNDVTDQFTELTLVDGTISVKAKVVNYGGIAVTTDENGAIAEIDGSSKEDVPTIVDVEVDHVVLNRTFPKGVPATVVLPFTIDTANVHGAQFYTVSLKKNEKGLWVAGGDSVKTQYLTANTPYIVIVSADDGQLTFDGPVTLNTSVENNTVTDNGDGSTWTFTATYNYHKWNEAETKAGNIYAFAAQNASGAKVGEFVQLGNGAWIRPMRAFLVYNPPVQAPAPTLAKSNALSRLTFASVEEMDLPGSIDFVILDNEEEKPTAISIWNSRPAEVKVMDRWFDMNGRKLNGKPTTKGIYYYNGKRVFVK